MSNTPNLFINDTTKSLTAENIIDQYNELAGHILPLESFVLKKTWRIGSLHLVQLYLNTIEQIMTDIQNEQNFYHQHHHDSLVHDKAIYILQGICALNFSAANLHGFANRNKSMTAIIDEYDQHQHERLIKWMKQKFTYQQLESLSRDNLTNKFFTIKLRGKSDDLYDRPIPSHIIQDAYDVLAYGQI